MLIFYLGVRIFGEDVLIIDIIEVMVFSYELEKVDIYLNSWGLEDGYFYIIFGCVSESVLIDGVILVSLVVVIWLFSSFIIELFRN